MKSITVTYGDNQGIGPEILKKIIEQGIFERLSSQYNCKYIIFGNLQDIGLQELPDYIELVQVELSNTKEYSFACVKKAIEYCLEYNCQGLVTGPINKAKWQDYNYNYSGQTELLSEITGHQAEMLFWANKQPDNKSKDWHVLLLTRHIALQDVPKALTLERIEQAVNTVSNHFDSDTLKIALAGLNPHAGDNGLIGTEEKSIWSNWIQGLGIEKIYSPDEIWLKSAKSYMNAQEQEYNVYLAPYHDQVLPLIKTVTNLQAVNVSIGLPFIRTSPDHGTAYNLVGTGLADIHPFVNAIEYASR